ncbi:hypothetical protein IPC1293_31205 [Pseudomonas aeruginosa]|nr:hypothetical protein AXW94_30130 [Pseudomonas aeruginosa]RPM25840.1 hypothetical protein IPC1293_31205 [Pseudomonas aeruginosa]
MVFPIFQYPVIATSCFDNFTSVRVLVTQSRTCGARRRPTRRARRLCKASVRVEDYHHVPEAFAIVLHEAVQRIHESKFFRIVWILLNCSQLGL